MAATVVDAIMSPFDGEVTEWLKVPLSKSGSRLTRDVGSNPTLSASKNKMDKRVDEYIHKQKSPQQEVCQELRRLIFDAFAEIEEEMRWGVPAYGDGRYYIVALKDHVNLGFSSKGLAKEDMTLFEGGGKTTRHIEIASLKNIDEKRIVRLLRLVKEKQG